MAHFKTLVFLLYKQRIIIIIIKVNKVQSNHFNNCNKCHQLRKSHQKNVSLKERFERRLNLAENSTIKICEGGFCIWIMLLGMWFVTSGHTKTIVMMAKLSSVIVKDSHPLQDTPASPESSFSDRLRYRRSVLPAAVRLYNRRCSQSTTNNHTDWRRY